MSAFKEAGSAAAGGAGNEMTDAVSTDPRRLADFDGRWILRRKIVQSDGSTGGFRGSAVWTRAGGHAEYAETGVLQLDHSGPFTAERRYRWSTDLDVFFEDGRFFHRVPPLGGEARHWCDPDLYEVSYDFSCWPAFSTVWRVQGPKKSYTMTSRYTRR